jgi:hypothetical protein
MAEDLEHAAALAYETYRQASQGTMAGGLPMPMWEHVGVPEHAVWMQVASALTGIPLPTPAAPAPAGEPPPASPPLWTQEDLEQLTVSDLREIAQEQHVSVPSSATKHQLIDALLGSQRGTQEG